MKALLWMTGAAAFALIQAAPPSTQVESRSVEGVITEAGSTQPIPGVQVALMSGLERVRGRATGTPVAAATTDTAGRFKFPTVTVGVYEVQIRREGYFRPGAASPTEANASLIDSLRVVAGQDVKGLAYSLTQGGTISGRVVDADGKPMSGVPLTVLQPGYDPDGKRLLYTRNLAQANALTGAGRPLSALTDDRGDYRLFWLTPGEYYIRAEIAPPQQAPLAGAASFATAGYVPTFHPSTVTQVGAVPVVVRGGQDATATNITLQKPRTYTVSGRLVLQAGVTLPVNPRGGVQPPSYQFFRRDEVEEASARRYRGVQNPVEPSDQFRISGILPGSYDVVTYVTGASASYGKVAIVVSDRDLNDAVIDVFPSVTLKAQITAEGAIPPRLTFQVNLISTTPGYPAPGANGTVGPFDIPNVPRGEYFVLVRPIGAAAVNGGAYVSDIRHGGRSLMNGGRIIAGADPAPIEVVLRSPGGSITGTMRGTGNGASRSVALVPQPPRRQSLSLYQSSAVNTGTGAFAFPSVAPGQYKLFSLISNEGRGFLDEQFLSRIESRGVPVTVLENGRVTGLELSPP